MNQILGLAFLVCMCLFMYDQVRQQNIRHKIDENLLRRIEAERTPQEKKEYDQYMEYGAPLELVDDKAFVHPPGKDVN